jgi:hypothetical protein
MFSTNHNEGLPEFKRSTSRGQVLTEIFCGKSNMEKKKREMTPEMLDTLAMARQRAVEVRRERAELKRKEKELRHLEEATKADDINERYAKVASRSKHEPTPAPEPDPAPEPAPPKRKSRAKPKPKEKPKEPPLEQEEYDTEEDVSESEPDEPEPLPPKSKRRPPRPHTTPQQKQQPAVNTALEEAYQSLFRYRY